MWKGSKSLSRRRDALPSLLQPIINNGHNDHLLLTRHNNQVGTEAVADRAFRKPPSVATTVINPRVVFPWRHLDYPLPRLIPGSEEFETQGGVLGPGFPPLDKYLQYVVTHFSASQMGTIPWYQLPFNTWKQDLADSASWAFSQAVAGMLANTYGVPFDDIRKEDDEDFDVNLTKHKIIKGSTEEDVFPELDYMVQEKLRTLYQSAHEHGRDNLQIELQMKPIGAWFLGSFMVPFLTREKVKENPALKDTFPDIWTALMEEEQKKGSDMNFMEIAQFVNHNIRLLARDQAEVLDDHMSLKSTVVAQVVVECDEIFSVTDLTTGKVIQGDGQVRRVPHLVRLEVVVDAQKTYGERGAHVELGAWQITDWDDLLEGNIWFM